MSDPGHSCARKMHLPALFPPSFEISRSIPRQLHQSMVCDISWNCQEDNGLINLGDSSLFKEANITLLSKVFMADTAQSSVPAQAACRSQVCQLSKPFTGSTDRSKRVTSILLAAMPSLMQEAYSMQEPMLSTANVGGRL